MAAIQQEPMRIAQIHNTYQIAGGEDRVVELEHDMLTRHGHAVETFQVTNDTITGLAAKAGAMLSARYNQASRAALLTWLKQQRPDVVHVHNFFPLLSPSIYDACADAGVPVVQTLHNFRTFCAGGFMLRNGRLCDKCLDGSRYWGIVHRCYRDSLPGSVGVAAMIREYHRAPERVHRYVALNSYAQRTFARSGLPPRRIVVKPNFVRDPGKPDGRVRDGGLFVGRLSEDKGVLGLVRAWRGVPGRLRIGGTGPLEAAVRKEAPPQTEMLGWLEADGVREAMQTSAFLLVPSLSTEQFPMAIVVAFSCGLPVIASRTDALSEIVVEGKTGLLCAPGDVDDLRRKIEWAIAHPDEIARMGTAARERYETLYSETVNYRTIMDIYAQAVVQARSDAAH